jgi:hypothetical protein
MMPKTGKPCRPCEMAWGVIGLAAGIVLLYMGADLLTGGALTAMISGRRAVDEETSDAAE